MTVIIDIDGLLAEPRHTAKGGVYQGRLTLPDVQWTGEGSDRFATFTATIEQIADAAENGVLWTDQAVQRGMKPTAPPNTPRELAVSAGFPDERFYIFRSDNADEMVDKLLHNDKLFLNPLVWNLRPGAFQGYWDEDAESLYLYSGRAYLPDSHHRHQAILKAARAFRDHPQSYPDFSLDKQFKVELYFFDQKDEGNYFFDKNQRPTPTALSKAYDLTSEDDLSTLAKRVLDLSPELDAGVNRATDRLSKSAPHFMTLSTLREIMRTFAGSSEVDSTELEGLAVIAAQFFKMLAEVRIELRPGTPYSEREKTLASAAVMVHGYAFLMRDYGAALSKRGSAQARKEWAGILARLAPDVVFQSGEWEGDFLSKYNPLWAELGITKENASTHRINVANTGGARARAGEALRGYLSGEMLKS